MMKSIVIAKVKIEGKILERKVAPLNPARDQLTKQGKGLKYPSAELTVVTSWSDEPS